MNNEFIMDDTMVMEYVGEGGDVVIPHGAEDIFFEAFYGAAPITSITVPGSILELSPFVFERCGELKVAKLCEGVSVINTFSFHDCGALEEIHLPNSLSSLKSGAIADCPSLKTIYYNGTEEEWARVDKEEGWDENTPDYEVVFCWDR